MRQAASRVVREQEPAVRGVDQDHPDRHVPEHRLQAVLRAAALLGHVPEAGFALADPALRLDPRRDVVERVDRDPGPVAERCGPGVDERPALGPVLRRRNPTGSARTASTVEDPPAGEALGIERVAVLVDHREARQEVRG